MKFDTHGNQIFDNTKFNTMEDLGDTIEYDENMSMKRMKEPSFKEDIIKSNENLNVKDIRVSMTSSGRKSGGFRRTPGKIAPYDGL